MAKEVRAFDALLERGVDHVLASFDRIPSGRFHEGDAVLNEYRTVMSHAFFSLKAYREGVCVRCPSVYEVLGHVSRFLICDAELNPK